MSGYVVAMIRYGTFRGRAGRVEFWTFVLICAAMLTAASFIDGALASYFGLRFGTQQNPIGAVMLLWYLTHLVPGIAVTVRRLHDIDRSGWFYFLSIAPIANFFLIYLLTRNGDNGPNRFGAATDRV